MTTSFKTIAAAAALSAAAIGPSLAADYDPPIFIEKMDEYVPVEVGSGWYLRGDLGYAVATRPNGAHTFRTYDAGTGTYGAGAFASNRIDPWLGFNAGIGVGYSFTDWLRADATIDASRLRFDGSTASATPCFGAAGATGCRSEDSQKAHAYTAMLNGYIDLGTFVGVTPYVGAGAGMTLIDWAGMRSNIYCVAGADPCGAPLAGTVNRPGLSDWRFTYAFMAGFAYDVSTNLKLDLGYKYRRVKGGSQFGFSAADAGAGATGVQGTDSGFTQHTINVGLRYALW